MPNSIKVSAPKFGAWLKLQRGDRSLEQIAMRVRRLIEPTGLRVDQSQIYRIEQGLVPSWPLLLAIVRVYDLSLDQTMRKMIEALDFPGASDLIRPADDVQRTSEIQPGPESPYEPVRSIADELLDLTATFHAALKDVTDRLPGDRSHATPHATPRRTRRKQADSLRSRRKVG
jgi:hypothetical protein